MSDRSSVLCLAEVAALLGRSPETLRKDLRRNPAAVPPRLRIDGTRLLRWRAQDVEAWLAQRVEGARHG
jgi:predicted DNA-binding transcriptional regulator AlpA